MNYRNENATPRDRYTNAAFSQNARTGYEKRTTIGCGCSNDADPADYGCGCNNKGVTHSANRSLDCGCNSTYNTRTSSRMNRNSESCNRSASCKYTRESRCGSQRGSCGSDNGFLHREAPIAMVYSPMQQWKELYDPHTALANGTIFKELDLPFYPTPCRRKENSQCQYR